MSHSHGWRDVRDVRDAVRRSRQLFHVAHSRAIIPVTLSFNNRNGEILEHAGLPLVIVLREGCPRYSINNLRGRMSAMGKKSRGKKRRDKWVRRKPDEVIARGPIRVERYGRFIRFSNTSTPSQHAAFLEHSEKINKQVLIDLERELAVLQGLVGKYDAVELMHRAAYMLLPLFMKYRSENEFGEGESYFLPTVEYIQYLIARTEPNADGTKPSESEWEEIWEQALRVMDLTHSHLITRGTITNPPTEIDELRFALDGQRLIVRVERYPLFFADHLRSSLAPYEKQMKELYGIGVDEIIEGLGKIHQYQKTGVLDRYRDVRETTNVLMEQLLGKGYVIDAGASPEEVERTRAALETEEFKVKNEEAQEKARLTFTPAIFEITDITSLPKPFLSLLSVKPGESVLKTLTGPDHDDLSPLSTSILHYKPFLEVGGKFYTFYHSGFDDHLADIIEADLFEKRPGQVSEMANRRGHRLESDAGDLLKAIIRSDFAYQNVYYPNPDDAGNLTELDHLIGVDDVLFLVEAKAGAFSAAASRGAPKSLAQGLSELIVEGQRQSERAEKYIRSAAEVAFFDATGKQEVHRIRHAHFRKVFRIVISREGLGWVGARIAVLSVLNLGLSKAFPWHVAIDDLRVIAELFKADEIRFVHYLELRLLASAEAALSQQDEIEHIGLYNKMNYYHELPVRDMTRVTFDASYMRDIDHYFMDRSAGIDSPMPTQAMPPKIREFISGLRTSGLHGRFEVGSMVLSMSSAARQGFKEALDSLDTGRAEGRQRTFRVPFTDLGFGFSVSYADGPRWLEELRRSAVQMEQGDCSRWLVVQMANKSPYEISSIEIITPGRFTGVELAAEKARHETRTQERIAAEKPGRNDPCPCGSGEKFKKCHG